MGRRTARRAGRDPRCRRRKAPADRSGRTGQGASVASVPVADGGDGTVDAAVVAGFGRREIRVTGPVGRPVTAAYALRNGAAVVEMAEASGLRHLPAGVFAPLTATSYGTGEVLRAALDAGARSITLGVGGSATTDGGAGMLSALGARFLDASGAPVGPGGAALARLAKADLSGLDPRLAEVDLVLASDVDNPLLGPEGAAAVYVITGEGSLDNQTLHGLPDALGRLAGPAHGSVQLGVVGTDAVRPGPTTVEDEHVSHGARRRAAR
ncbi:glycerate kinase [Streptomyces albiflaviniger]|nr:glycerate kinase [Streptomyces albiflaviniger]